MRKKELFEFFFSILRFIFYSQESHSRRIRIVIINKIVAFKKDDDDDDACDDDDTYREDDGRPTPRRKRENEIFKRKRFFKE